VISLSFELSSFIQNLGDWVKERPPIEPPLDEMFKEESDRAFGIVVACYLDNMLEKLIRASFIKDAKVNALFKNPQLLQSFSNKIDVAYFSGLIPKFVYHDLKLICEIRNKFAHKVTAELEFTDEVIARIIDRCLLRPKTLDDVQAPKLKFVIIATLIATFLDSLETMLNKVRPPKLMDMCAFEDLPDEEMILTKKEIIDILSKHGIQPKT